MSYRKLYWDEILLFWEMSEYKNVVESQGSSDLQIDKLNLPKITTESS